LFAIAGLKPLALTVRLYTDLVLIRHWKILEHASLSRSRSLLNFNRITNSTGSM